MRFGVLHQQFTVLIRIQRDAIDVRSLLVKIFVAEFVAHIVQNQQAGSGANGQPQHVDKRIEGVLYETAVGDGNVFAKHKSVGR